MTTNLFESALRNGFIVERNNAEPAPANISYAAAIELGGLGFIVFPENLKNFSEESLVELITAAQSIVGADRNMEPIYPGFPKQVQELDTVTLLVEQLLHYWSYGTLLPDHPKEFRPGLPIEEVLKEYRGVSSLKVCTVSELINSTLSKVASSKISIGEQEIRLLDSLALESPEEFLMTAGTLFFANGENLQKVVESSLKSGVPAVEVFEILGKASLNNVLRVFLSCFAKPSKDGAEEAFERAVKNLSDTDAWSVAFKSVPRKARRLLVSRMGSLSNGWFGDLLVARKNLWRKIVRTVHGFELSRSAKEKRALDIVSDNIAYQTFNSLVEELMSKNSVSEAISLLAENNPGNLVRRLVSLLRMVESPGEAVELSNAVLKVGNTVPITTLVSAYNGLLSANSDTTRVSRVAGRLNKLLERDVKKVDETFLELVTSSVREVIKSLLKEADAPTGPVGVLGDSPVSLVKRDLSVTDRVIDRGERIALPSGRILRFFGHWNNTQSKPGYMDIGVVVLDDDAEILGICDWESWSRSRAWATYSGDKLVKPGDSAAEFIDVDLEEMKKVFPTARFIAMTVQSWSGFPMANVDFLAGVMVRDEENSGEVFEAKTVSTAFKPTTKSLQSVPLVFDLETGKMIWIDSSSGNTRRNVSLRSDNTIGSIVFDEVLRPRLTVGEFARWWAEAHDATVLFDEVAPAPETIITF